MAAKPLTAEFIHLHVHSHYSLLNALPMPKELAAAAKADGQDALAITDNGALYGAIDFYKACQKLRLKPPYKDQFDRALLSVLLNLAEGAAKPTAKDRRKFYAIAMGSLREVQVILDLVDERELLKRADPIAASLWRLGQNPGGRA